MRLSFAIFSAGKSKEAESKRINKELANIRSKFKGIVSECFLKIKCKATVVAVNMFWPNKGVGDCCAAKTNPNNSCDLVLPHR